jgi:VWFA-related protein
LLFIRTSRRIDRRVDGGAGMIRAMATGTAGVSRIACLVLALSLGATAQVPREQAAPIQLERSVTLKLVQVYVMDKAGRPVTDLLAADFELSDNGRPMTVTEFETHALVSPGGPGETAETSPGDARLNRKFLLLFDFAFNNPRGFAQAKKAALHFLAEEVRPSDEVGVISYALFKGLTFHEYFTADHAKVREVVEGFSQKSLVGRAQYFEAEYWKALEGVSGDSSLSADSTRAGGRFGTASQLLEELTIDRMNYQLHVRNFTQRMTDLARTLRLVPGYKHIVLFSAGVAGSVFQGAPVALDRDKVVSARARGQASLYNINSLDAGIWEEKKYDYMVKELAQANCPVYVLNTEDPTLDAQMIKAMSGEYPLKKLSKTSGGQYFPRVDDYRENLARIEDTTGAYYVLGYSIGEKGDGKFHDIKVKVRRKGCEVRAQGGYFNPKPFREYTEFEKTVHFMDVALSDDPQLQTPAVLSTASLAFPAGKDNVLMLLSRIPKDIFTPAGKGPSEVVTLVFDRQKNIVGFKRATVSPAALVQSESCHYTYSLLPPGEYDCRVVVRDLESGSTAVGKESVVVPGASAAPLVLLPPLLLRPGADVHYFGVQSKPGAPAGAGPASLTALFPFDPKRFSPLVGGLAAGSREVHAMLICGLEGGRGSDPELSFSLMESVSGTELPVPHEVLSSQKPSQDGENRSRLAVLVRIELPPLGSGSYVLRVKAEDPTTGAAAETAQKLALR